MSARTDEPCAGVGVRMEKCNLAKSVLKLKEKNKAAFFSLSENRCLPASEVQTHEEVLSLGKLCDENEYSYEWINGQKPHLIKNGIRIQCNTENFVPIVVPGLSSSSSSSSHSSTSMTPSRQERNHPTSTSSSCSSPTTTVLSYSETREREDLSGIDSHPVLVSNMLKIERRDPLLPKPTKNPKPNKNETTIERGDPLCSDIPEWLQEFRENLVDDRVPEHRDSYASSSHEVFLEPTSTRREDLGKHNVHTHFPKDRNCDICKRTKITRAPCRRRSGEAVPRAANSGDLTSADHKVLSDNCESRNNHRYAVVVQDLAIQWIQAYPCKKKKLPKKPREACKSSWSPIGILKSFTVTTPWNLAKPVKISPGIIARLHHTDRRLTVLRKEQCAE